MSTLSLSEVKAVVKELLKRYHAEYALLFGSYARGDATPDSDIDIIIVGGKDFVPRNIFALAEDLREMTGRDADVVVGKPNRLILDRLADRWNLPTADLLMVGDRLYTDIALGHTAGVHTALVLTGETHPGDLLTSPYRPEFVFATLLDLIALLS